MPGKLSLPAIVPVTTDAHRAEARELIAEYLHWINESAQREYGLNFDVNAMIAADLADGTKFQPPFGRFYVVHDGTAAIAVGCLKRLNEQVGEVQRMYVRASQRGKGVGRLIVDRLIADAREIGYRTLRLESLKFLAAAHALYRSVGFVEISPYAGNSMENYHVPDLAPAYRASVLFMELAL
jgi:GNAT superfamily N-acetyltransferase